MPTHFRTGVSNAKPNTLLYDWGGGMVPYSHITYFNDFLTYTTSDWTVTETGTGTRALSSALAAAGGALVVTNGAVDDNVNNLQLVGEAFRFHPQVPMWFAARFRVSDATQSDFFMGLSITDTSLVASAPSDYIGFAKADGSTSVSFNVAKDSTTTTVSAVHTMADAAFVVLGFFYDPGDSLFHIFVNDVEVGTAAATNAPDDEDMTVSFAIQNGEAVAKNMVVDYIFASQRRAGYDWD